jgi:hypothetical protein
MADHHVAERGSDPRGIDVPGTLRAPLAHCLNGLWRAIARNDLDNLAASLIEGVERTEHGLVVEGDHAIEMREIGEDPQRGVPASRPQVGLVAVLVFGGVVDATQAAAVDPVKVVAVPSPEVGGMTMSAIVGITVDMNAYETVAAALEALPQTRYVGYSTGPYDLIIELFFRSHEELLVLLSKKLAKIPGIIKTDTSVILKVTKFAYEWEIPTE